MQPLSREALVHHGHTNVQVRCPQCGKLTTFNQLVEGDTRSGPLGTKEEGGRAAGQDFANACNLVEAAAAGPSGGDGGGPSDPNARGAAAIWEAEQAAAAGEDVELEELSLQMGALVSPSKPPAPKKPKKGGDGGSSSQAIELSQ